MMNYDVTNVQTVTTQPVEAKTAQKNSDVKLNEPILSMDKTQAKTDGNEITMDSEPQKAPEFKKMNFKEHYSINHKGVIGAVFGGLDLAREPLGTTVVNLVEYGKERAKAGKDQELIENGGLIGKEYIYCGNDKGYKEFLKNHEGEEDKCAQLKSLSGFQYAQELLEAGSDITVSWEGKGSYNRLSKF